MNDYTLGQVFLIVVYGLLMFWAGHEEGANARKNTHNS